MHTQHPHIHPTDPHHTPTHTHNTRILQHTAHPQHTAQHAHTDTDHTAHNQQHTQHRHNAPTHAHSCTLAQTHNGSTHAPPRPAGSHTTRRSGRWWTSRGRWCSAASWRSSWCPSRTCGGPSTCWAGAPAPLGVAVARDRWGRARKTAGLCSSPWAECVGFAGRGKGEGVRPGPKTPQDQNFYSPAPCLSHPPPPHLHTLAHPPRGGGAKSVQKRDFEGLFSPNKKLGHFIHRMILLCGSPHLPLPKPQQHPLPRGGGMLILALVSMLTVQLARPFSPGPDRKLFGALTRF